MRSIWTRTRSKLAWGKIATAFALATMVTLATVLFFGMLGNPSTLAVVHAQSEYVRYRVFNESMAAIPANGFRISIAEDPEHEGACATGTIVPASDALVEYIVDQQAGLIVTISNGVRYELANGTIGHGDIALVSDRRCGNHAAKLPVWGPGQVGNLFAVRSDGVDPVLISGTVDVFGRTLELGPLGSGGALYNALAQPIRLPSGGAIWTDGGGAAQSTRDAPENSAFFGFVAFGGERSLEVSVTTEAPELEIIAPGGELVPSRIEIGFFAQAINDPNILRVQIAFVIFFLLFPIAMDFVLLATAKDKK